MAVRIPTYERHVQLDAAAQTMPRFTANTETGKALTAVGDAMMKLGAHWQAKQDQFDKLQAHQAEALLHEQIRQITTEETLKFDPSHDPPGTLHNRIMQRVGQAVEQYKATVPQSQRKDAEVKGNGIAAQTGIGAAVVESHTTNTYATHELDNRVGAILKQVKTNPDSGHDAVKQVDAEIASLDKLGTITAAQKQKMRDGYMSAISNAANEGFQAQGRDFDGKEFADKFAKDREAEGPVQFQQQRLPGVRVLPGQPGAKSLGNKTSDATDTQDPNAPRPPGSIPASGSPDDNRLNQKRIAEIDAKPEIKAAIEKVAAETNTDPNVLKVAASIESSGNPNAVSPSGNHHGLFQITKTEMGMNGSSAAINDPEANTRAYVALLHRNEPQLEKALGRPPTDKELYIAHQQGVAGAATHINNPDQPAYLSMLSTGEGKQKGEDWAKAAVKENIPKDVLTRLFGGDVTKVTSGDMLAIQGTRFSGGNIDEAVTTARVAPRPGEKQVITADASGRVIDTDQNDQPRSIIGGNVNAGGPAQPPQAFSVAGLPIQTAYAPGQTFGRSATASAEPFKSIVVHYTGGDSLQSALNTQISGDPSRGGGKFGYHFYIDKDGTVYQGAPLDARTNHVQGWPVGGRTSRPDINNNNAIGVAYVGSGEPNAEQIKSGHALISGLQRLDPNAPIPKENIVGHGEIQGGSRSPEEGMGLVRIARSDTPAPALVGDDGSGRPAAPAALSRWQMDADRQKNALDGAAMKAGAMRTDYTKKLQSVVKDDVSMMAGKGHGVVLSKDMQDYFHTDKLSFDFISNRLGTGTALTWQEQREHAQKFYEGTSNFPVMSADAISEQLQKLKPDDNSGTYTKDVAVYKDVVKAAQSTFKDRLKDPAAAADLYPAVKEARDAAYADPKNPDKAKTLVDLRVRAMNLMGITPAQQSPITNDEARTLAVPLTALTDPDATHSLAGAEVARNVIRTVGNDPELATKAMERVLKQKGVSKETAQAAAGSLQAAKNELLQQQEVPLPVDRPKGAEPGKAPSLAELSGFGYHDTMPYWSGGADQSASDEVAGAREGYFSPGRDLIPHDRIQTLVQNKDNEEARNIFNRTYGQGAAEYFIKENQGMSGATAATQPTGIDAAPVSPDGNQGDFTFPLPTQDPGDDTTPDPKEF